MLITILVFLLILSILVYVHEFGHFFTAKLSKIRVEEFAFGFRPRLLAKKIGQTVYAINAIPLGGYVRLYGEDGTQKGQGSFRAAGFWRRLLVLIAGSTMNLVLAWVILTALFIHGFDPIVPGVGSNPYINQHQSVEVTAVGANSPGQVAGLAIGDQILTINGQEVTSDANFVDVIAKLKGQSVRLEFIHSGQNQTVNLVPRVSPPAGQGPIGVGIRSVGQVKASVAKAPLAGIYETGRAIWLSLAGFGNFIKQLVIHRQVSDEVTGIVGVGVLTGVVRQLGFQYLAQFVALISIGLGVINLVPILPLDGGHALILIYEKISRRTLTEKQLNSLATIGIALVGLLFVIVTYKDIIRYHFY